MAAEPQRTLGADAASASFWAREADALAYNAAERRVQAPLRFFVCLLVAFGAATSLNFPQVRGWLWGWLALNVTLQTLEIAVLWPVRPGGTLAGRLRVLLGLVCAGGVSTVVEVAPWSRIPEARALLVPRDD